MGNRARLTNPVDKVLFDLHYDWWVYSTAVADHVLLVECRKTGLRGYVPDPSTREWYQAHHAPSHSYRWRDTDRVVFDDSTSPPFSPETKEAALNIARRLCEVNR